MENWTRQPHFSGILPRAVKRGKGGGEDGRRRKGKKKQSKREMDVVELGVGRNRFPTVRLIRIEQVARRCRSPFGETREKRGVSIACAAWI